MHCRILALYLPQFHRIKENDEWWGEGFTEWNNVKSAKPLYRGARQPRVPLGGYYDLSKSSDIKRQAEAAKKGGIDGFVIYSYYSDGEMLLEKPAEILLENKDISIDFCFSWANHHWRRTWYSHNHEMLREQKYAVNADQIEAHFNYYLPFFKDKRYIKHNNKPVFFVWDAPKIPGFENYKKIWNELARKNGFDGIFFVQTLGETGLIWDKSLFDACFNFEPFYTMFTCAKARCMFNKITAKTKKKLKLRDTTSKHSHKSICRKMIRRCENDSEHCLGFFGEFDDTPRHYIGADVISHFSLESFEKTFYAQLKKSIENKKPFLVINAWNEWGEGAFLEPDTIYGNKKLEIISKCKSILLEECQK